MIDSSVKLQVPFQVHVKVEVTHDALIYEWKVYEKKYTKFGAKIILVPEKY